MTALCLRAPFQLPLALAIATLATASCLSYAAQPKAVRLAASNQGLIDLSPADHAEHRVVVEVDLRFEAVLTPESADTTAGTAADTAAEASAATTSRPEDSTETRGQIRLAYRQAPLANGRVVRVVDSLDVIGSGAALRQDRRVLLAEPTAEGVRVAAVGGPLLRSELDLVQPSADPLDLAALLPGYPLADGGAWRVDTVAVERLLGVQSCTVADLTGIVSDANASFALLKFAGPVHGLVDGARVEMDVRGAALFDRTSRQITRMNLAWQEERTLGPATPAMQAKAKLNVLVRPPAKEDRNISASTLAEAAAAPFDPRLLITTGDGQWSLLSGREWFIVAAGADATTLRQVAGESVGAIATFTSRTDNDTDVERLQEEFRMALGNQIQQFTETNKAVSESGIELTEVAAIGAIDGRPTVWRRFHAASKTDAVAITATIAAADDLTHRGSVRRLVETLRPATTEVAKHPSAAHPSAALR